MLAVDLDDYNFDAPRYDMVKTLNVEAQRSDRHSRWNSRRCGEHRLSNGDCTARNSSVRVVQFLDNVFAASNEHPVKSLTITDVSIVG